MPRMSRLIQSTAIALCLPATAALADLTAADVWADWKSYMTESGYSVSGNEEAAGDTLTVDDVVLNMDFADADEIESAGIILGTMQFVERDDGSVDIELPGTSSVAIAFQSETGETINVAIDVSQSDHSYVASGDPSALRYVYQAGMAQVNLAELMVDGVSLGEQVAKVNMTMNEVGITTDTTSGDGRSIAQVMSISSIDYDLSFNDPAGEGAFSVTGAVEGVGVDGTGAMPFGVDTQDFNAMLKAGLFGAGTLTTQGGTYDASFNGPEGSGTINGVSEGSTIGFSMSSVGLAYDIVQRNVAVNMLVSAFPLPVSFNAAEMGSSFQMPLQKSQDEQDFGLGLTLSDFTMSDVIWSLFDPSAQLPREPATIAVDLSGKAKLLLDLLDADQAEVLEETGAVPGELNALTLNTLNIDAAGAKLTGSGDFVFDNTDLTTFDGLPRPEGGIDLQLVGGNGLLDKLVNMGLLPEDQAIGARMMMGLFAVPGEGADTLNSRIEVNDQGHVLANGQRIR